MPTSSPPRARSAAARSVESPSNNARALARGGVITVVEVVPAGQAALPARRPRGALDPVRRLAGLLEAMAAPGSAAIDELSFRKAVEALAPASRSAMASDLACFAEFCGATRRIAMPATPATIVAYIDHLEQQTIGSANSPIKPATIVRRLGSIASAHALMDLPSPTKASVVTNTMKGMKKRRTVAQRQAVGVRFGDGDAPAPARLTFSAMLMACGGDIQGLRDAALISLGYDAGLRVSELLAVQVEHLEGETDGTGLLFIPRAKTDQEGEGAWAWVSADSMRRIAAWLSAAEIDAGFIFRRVGIERRAAVAARPARSVSDLAPNAHIDWRRMRAQNAQPARVRYAIGTDPLTRKGVNLIYRRMALRAAALGLVDLAGDELQAALSRLSTHSLRVGLTQDLFAAGEDVGQICQALRWQSTGTALRYARKLAPRDNAAARVVGKLRT
jgi:integrase